jgi:hypothetical protein
MTTRGGLAEAARALRRRWPSVVVSSAAVTIVALVPLPIEGHSALAVIGGAGLGGELLEQLLRASIWGAYKTMQRIACAGLTRCARTG